MFSLSLPLTLSLSLTDIIEAMSVSLLSELQQKMSQWPAVTEIGGIIMIFSYFLLFKFISFVFVIMRKLIFISFQFFSFSFCFSFHIRRCLPPPCSTLKVSLFIHFKKIFLIFLLRCYSSYIRSYNRSTAILNSLKASHTKFAGKISSLISQLSFSLSPLQLNFSLPLSSSPFL